MTLLRTLEKRIARLVEGGFSRVFKSTVQPVEIARRLKKEMDDHQQRTVREVYVPHEYTVFLSGADYESFAGIRAAITTELGEYLAEHARRSGFAMLARPRVNMTRDEDLSKGFFGIATSMSELPQQAPTPAQPTMVQPAPVAVPAPAPAALVLVTKAGSIPLEATPIRIGRGSSNTLVLQDSSVSREHAEIIPVAGGWTLRDLDSTNGVAVNGARVREHVLHPGDQLLLGNVQIRVDLA
jgi:hypothetical protein